MSSLRCSRRALSTQRRWLSTPHHLFSAFPHAAEVEAPSGSHPVPFHLAGGSSLMVAGLASQPAVQAHLRYEGQHVCVPSVVRDADPSLVDAPQTPVVVTATRWADSDVGPYDELAVYLTATYFEYPQSFIRNPWLVPWMMYQIPSARLYPLLTMVSTERAAEYLREVLRVPAVSADVSIDCGSGGVTGFSVTDGVPGMQLVRGPICAATGGVSSLARLRGAATLLNFCGGGRVVSSLLDKFTRYPVCVPHGRGPRKGFGIGGAAAKAFPVGTVSGVDMGGRALQAHSDCSFFASTDRSAVRLWSSGTDSVSIGGSLEFEPDAVIQLNGVTAVRGLPQVADIPLYSGDQDFQEVPQAVKKAREALAQRWGLMERADGDEGRVMDPIDISRQRNWLSSGQAAVSGRN